MTSTGTVTVELIHNKIRQTVQSSNVQAVQREITLFGKNVQQNYFNWRSSFHNSSNSKLFCLFLSIIVLNILVTTYLTTFAAQITVGLGGNIMYWHHPYITPDLSEQKQIKIPKIIHQTYTSLDSVPQRWKQSIELWQKHHADWEYRFWSDDDIENFMKEHYSWFMPFYYAYPHHIQRVDVVRYFILYHFGGIYCDLDISPKQNIEPLLSGDIDMFIVETPNLGTTNSLFGSTKNSDFLFYVINSLCEYYNTGYYQSFLPKHMQILFSTGPTAFWALYGKYYSNASGPKDTFGILPNKYFGRLAVCFPNPGKSEMETTIKETSNRNILQRTSESLRCNMKSFEHSYFYHVEGNSWHNSSSWYINYFLGCQPVTTVFMMAFVGWIMYCGIYQNKYKYLKSVRLWFKRNFIFICGSTLLILTMYFWRFVLFYVQNMHCK